MDLPYNFPMEVSHFEDEKAYNKFINCCKREIRGSVEYSEWVKFIKQVIGMDYCALTKEVSDEVTVEVHHHPYSLHNLIRCVVDTKIAEGKSFTTFDISKEVMSLHYEGKVGFILLVKTLHEKFHNGFLKLPIDLVYGDWKDIENIYIVAPDIKELVEKYTSYTLEEFRAEYGENYTWSKDHYFVGENIDV